MALFLSFLLFSFHFTYPFTRSRLLSYLIVRKMYLLFFITCCECSLSHTLSVVTFCWKRSKNEIKSNQHHFWFWNWKIKWCSIQNNAGGSSASSSPMCDINNNNNTRCSDNCTDCEQSTPLGPLANLVHLVVEFIKGAYPIFPALVIYYQSHSVSLAVVTFVLTLGLIVYLQLRMINRDWLLVDRLM